MSKPIFGLYSAGHLNWYSSGLGSYDFNTQGLYDTLRPFKCVVFFFPQNIGSQYVTMHAILIEMYNETMFVPTAAILVIAIVSSCICTLKAGSTQSNMANAIREEYD